MFWLMSILAVVGVFTSSWMRWRYKNRRMLAMAAKLPGPPSLPILGNALKFICQPEGHINPVFFMMPAYALDTSEPSAKDLRCLSFTEDSEVDKFIIVIKDLITTYGDILRFWLGPDLCIVVNNPDDLKTLLTSSKISIKGPQYKYMADVLGGGILSGSGPTWRKHRKIANPNYGKRAIGSYEEIFHKEVNYLMEKFHSIQKHPKIFDIYFYIVQCTSYAVCQTLMGLSREQTLNLPHLQYLIDETPRLYDIVFDRMTKWYLQVDPVFYMTKSYKEQKQFIQKMSEFSRAILEHRLEYLKTLRENADNKIDLLMNSAEDSVTNTQLSVIDRFLLSQELSPKELLQETFTIFTSSQEASAKIASFILLMMAYHPHCQEKLYNEIKSVIGDTDRAVTDEDFKRMPYLEMVFKEVLRLFPIGAILQRTVNEDIVIGSGVLPAGSSLVIPIYHLQRDPRYWDKPEEFDPERFNPENTKLRHPNCYIPFSLGPMDCLGRYFGTKLVKTICVRVLREFEVRTSETYKDLRVMIAVSVASINGYPVTLKLRN